MILQSLDELSNDIFSKDSCHNQCIIGMRALKNTPPHRKLPTSFIPVETNILAGHSNAVSSCAAL